MRHELAGRQLQMNEKDKELLSFIVEYTKEHLFPPTIREMCEAIGVSSTSTVHTRLQKLERMDEIRVNDNGRITITGYHLEEDPVTAMNRM